MKVQNETRVSKEVIEKTLAMKMFAAGMRANANLAIHLRRRGALNFSRTGGSLPASARASALMLVSLLAIGATQFAYAEENSRACTLAGPENAKVTVEEFVDFQCPFCSKSHETLNEVLHDYPGQVKVVLRHRPLPFHDQALIAAKAVAAVCLQSPNLAIQMKEQIFSDQKRLSREGEKFLIEAAGKVGANIEQMKKDMKGEEVGKVIASDQKRAAELGVNGTPTLIVGSEKIVGAWPPKKLKQVIERQMNPI